MLNDIFGGVHPPVVRVDNQQRLNYLTSLMGILSFECTYKILGAQGIRKIVADWQAEVEKQLRAAVAKLPQQSSLEVELCGSHEDSLKQQLQEVDVVAKIILSATDIKEAAAKV